LAALDNRALWSVHVGQHPQSGAVPTQDFQPVMPLIGEHKERTLPRILAQSLSGQIMQAVEPFAHVASLYRDEHLETAGEG
jgi:hypothetical protein